ncbi:MAG TPA: hypothetical protein PK347_01210, partial [Burkholderiaceae bacterium]|nr:hypothetical protein [Burkholderiaceae bacterium]
AGDGPTPPPTPPGNAAPAEKGPAAAAPVPAPTVGATGAATPGPAEAPPKPASGEGAANAPRADGLPPWFDRLPPEMQERFKAMNAEERKIFIEQMRERRRQREAQGG